MNNVETIQQVKDEQTNDKGMTFDDAVLKAKDIGVDKDVLDVLIKKRDTEKDIIKENTGNELLNFKEEVKMAILKPFIDKQKEIATQQDVDFINTILGPTESKLLVFAEGKKYNLVLNNTNKEDKSNYSLVEIKTQVSFATNVAPLTESINKNQDLIYSKEISDKLTDSSNTDIMKLDFLRSLISKNEVKFTNYLNSVSSQNENKVFGEILRLLGLTGQASGTINTIFIINNLKSSNEYKVIQDAAKNIKNWEDVDYWAAQAVAYSYSNPKLKTLIDTKDFDVTKEASVDYIAQSCPDLKIINDDIIKTKKDVRGENGDLSKGLTRSEFIKLILDKLNASIDGGLVMKGIDAQGMKPPVFTDYTANSDKSKKYVETAKAIGLVNGVGGTLFSPDNVVNAQEVSFIMRNYFSLNQNSKIAERISKLAGSNENTGTKKVSGESTVPVA
ncbi:MAG: hypothetical protein PHF46_02930 [Candidatus Gracilibacteria bacterium]|nr:hypothetical protein [Candidatus Gracilibacteria bacterium]